MANALKCDRCGSYFDYDPEAKFNFIAFGHKDIIVGKNFPVKDICPDCMEQFTKWFENPDSYDPQDLVKNITEEDVAENSVNEYEEEIKKLKKENEKLQHEYDLCLNSENALKYSVDYLNKSIAKLNTAIYSYKDDLYKVTKRCRELEEENIKLKKRINSVYGSWFTSQPSTRDYLDSLLESSKYAIPYTTEWIKPPTKREEMWDKIFELHKENDVIIEVKKEDVNTFLHEIENKIPEITWVSGVKIFEAKGTIEDIYAGLKTHDVNYFRLRKENKLSFSSDPDIYQYKDLKHIDYFPPMRWDLYKKGRIVVGVRNNYELGEFRKQVEINTGIKDIPMYPTNFCLFYSFDKDNYKIILETIEQTNIAKINGHKVIYWEDVR